MASQPARAEGPSRDALWSQRFRQPLQLTTMAADWLAAAGNDPGARAFGELQMAWGHRYRNELAPAEQCLARALALYQSLDDEDGLANSQDHTAKLW